MKAKLKGFPMKKSVLFLLSILLVTVIVSTAEARSLVAELHGTKADSKITGEVRFHPTEKGVMVMAHVEGVSPGKHGFHIHEKGDCGDFGNAAGGHFNPDGLPHGDVVKDSIQHVHAGDLGNIEVGADGKGDLEKEVAGLSLDKGKFGVAGRSVVLHEKTDDFGQPTGNAGSRIACAEIPS